MAVRRLAQGFAQRELLLALALQHHQFLQGQGRRWRGCATMASTTTISISVKPSRTLRLFMVTCAPVR